MSKDLYTEIINNEQMTNTFDRDSLISEYAELVVDDMDLKTLVQLAYDVICENMERMTDNEIVEDVNNCYPELLEQYNIDPDMYLWFIYTIMNTNTNTMHHDYYNTDYTEREDLDWDDMLTPDQYLDHLDRRQYERSNRFYDWNEPHLN